MLNKRFCVTIIVENNVKNLLELKNIFGLVYSFLVAFSFYEGNNLSCVGLKLDTF